jgi:hypothetical protein
MNSMTYDQQCETLKPFVSFREMDPLVFAFFGVADVRNETGQSPSLCDGVGKSGIFVPQTPLEVGAARRPHASRAMRRIASRRAVKSDQPRRCASGAFPSTSPGQAFEAAPAALRTRPPVGSPGRERVAQKRTQVVETIGARKLVRGAETGKRS